MYFLLQVLLPTSLLGALILAMHTPFGKDCSEEKKDQPIRSLWNVLEMFLWLKIAQNEIQELALVEIAASMHSQFCPNLADLSACVLPVLQKG